FCCQAQTDGNADETRYFDAKWHERLKTEGGGAIRRGTGATQGAMPAGAGQGRMSMRRGCRSAPSHDEMKERDVRLAADPATHGAVDPRCRHDTPLFIAHSS